MKSLKFNKNYIEISLSMCLFIAIIFPKLLSLGLILAILSSLIALVKKDVSFRMNKVSLLFILLYLAYLIGVFWTQNEAQAMKYLENKMSFLLLPLTFSFVKKEKFEINLIFKSLVFSSLLSFVINICLAFKCYDFYGSIPYCFIKGHLSGDIHPTYLSFLLSIAIVSVYQLWKTKDLQLKWGIVLFSILSLYTILLMSLSGLIFFLLIVFGFVLRMIYFSLSFKKFLIVLLTMLVLIFMFFIKTPFIKSDVEDAAKFTNEYFKSPKKFIENASQEPSGTETRIIMWTVSLEEFVKHPFGVGTGNIDAYLSANLVSKNKVEFSKFQYNPHNQFLQTGLEIGLIGLLILILILFFGIKYALLYKSVPLLVVTLSLFMNSLFESMLQSQFGIIFYPLFFLIFIAELKSRTKQTKIS
ncbi:MAG: O-antigen ligase family protein [Bacteroidota bacterium]